MKILHIISSMNPEHGGVCKAVRDIIKGIATVSSEYINEVVCLDDAEEEFIKKDDFKVYALGAGKTSWNYSSKLKKWLYAHAGSYEKVIVHGLWQYQSYAVHQVWKKNKFTYFVMPHGMLDPYFQRAQGRRLKAIRNNILWALVEDKLINNANGLLFTCAEEKRLAAQTFKTYTPKTQLVVGLGVDPPPEYNEIMENAFSQKATGWNGKPFWLFFSRINTKKGIDLLISAYTNLTSKQSDVPQLIIAGPGLDTDFGKEMEALARPNKNILFTGMLSGNAKWGALYCCEIFILPSHQENFGIAVAEAMACGKPVAITDQVNIWTVIEENNAGFVFSANLSATQSVLANIQKERKLNLTQAGKSAKAAYQAHYKPKQAAQELLKALDFK